MNQLNFAIVGAGTAADFHIRAMRACSDLGIVPAAIVHNEPALFTAISNKSGIPCITIEEALSDPNIHAFSICTPSGMHTEQAILAAKAGKHVLVEKPMALTLSDADRMIQTCTKMGVKLGVVLQRRTEPLFSRIKLLLNDNILGDLVLGVVTLPYFRSQAYYESANWRGTISGDGGGILMNQGIHIIDLLLWWMGNPTKVSGGKRTAFRNIEVEDIATAIVEFESGALATIAGTTDTEPGFPHRIEVYGTRGCIQIEGESIIRWQVPDSIKPLALQEINSLTGPGSDPKAISINGHIRIIQDFVESIRTNKKPLIDGQEGRKSLQLISGIYKAAQSETIVRLI